MGINDKKKKKKGLGRAPESIPYTDDNMNDIFYSSGQSDDFNVSTIGRVGIDANANLTVKNVGEVNRVLYDFTSKPPGTIEWE